MPIQTRQVACREELENIPVASEKGTFHLYLLLQALGHCGLLSLVNTPSSTLTALIVT